MKNYFFIQLFLVVFFSMCVSFSLQGKESDKVFYVFAKQGIKLREKPSTKSNAKVLSYGTKVFKIKQKKKLPLDVGRLKGYWAKVKVKSKGKKTKYGFMFDGFLLPFPAPILWKQKKANFPLQTYSKFLAKKSVKVNWEGNSEDLAGGTLTISLNSLQEAFILLKRIYNLPASFKFPSKYRKVYVETEGLDAEHTKWKIHELNILRDKDFNILEMEYIRKNHKGNLSAKMKSVADGKFEIKESVSWAKERLEKK